MINKEEEELLEWKLCSMAFASTKIKQKMMDSSQTNVKQ